MDAERIDTEAHPNPVRLPSKEEMDRAQAALLATLPRPDIPPMANLALVRELALGEDSTRALRLQDGTEYRVPALGYLDGLQLTKLLQDLSLILRGDGVLERLPELREVYRALADIFRRVVLPRHGEWHRGDDPFVGLTAAEFREFASWLLDDGNEVPIPPAVPTPQATYRPYDALTMLLTYGVTVGHLPGWTVPPGVPATWRHYCAVRDYVTRRDAQREWRDFLVAALPSVSDQDLRSSVLDDIRRRAGL